MNTDRCISSRDKVRSHLTNSCSPGAYNVPGNMPSAGNPSGCATGTESSLPPWSSQESHTSLCNCVCGDRVTKETHAQ